MKQTGFANFILKFLAMVLLVTLSIFVVANETTFSSPFVAYAEDLSQVDSQNSANVQDFSTSTDDFYQSVDYISALAKFDPRDALTPIKDQSGTNLCWAYSAINASEAAILKNKLASKDDLRLNPKALAYRKYYRNADPLGNNANYASPNGGDWTQKEGNIGITAPLLSMWQGPIAGDKPAANVWENAQYRFESANLIWSDLSGEDRIEEIKRAIAKYGAVTASCSYDGGTKPYYNDNAATGAIPHAITLVGWDDNIGKDLFKPGKVGRNGGWLVKNSYSDNGYFWLTYESKIAKTTAWAFEYAQKDAYDFNYYYDNNEQDFGISNVKQAANVFEAKKWTQSKFECFEAVNVGFVGNDVTVNVKVYTNLSGMGQVAVERGTLSAQKSQTFQYGGYNTIKLDKPVQVEKGTYFSIVVEVSNKSGDAVLSIAQNDVNKPSFRKTYDGYAPIYGGCVARIKAYTKLKDADAPQEEHDYGKLVPKVESTCTLAGVETHYRCLKCGKYFDENKRETTRESLEIAIDSSAHSHTEWINQVPATCTEQGVKGHKTCQYCGKNFDKDGGEIADLTIPKANHSFGKWAAEVAPTVDKEGVKAHKDCTVCHRHFDEHGNQIDNLSIAKLKGYKVVVNGGEGGGYVAVGNKITVKANAPEQGKIFKGWQDASGKIVSTDAEYTFTVTGETQLVAVYASAPTGGDISGDIGGTTPDGGENTPSAPSTPTPSAPSTPTPDVPSDSNDKRFPKGAIVGIVLAAMLLVSLFGFAIYRFKKKKNARK